MCAELSAAGMSRSLTKAVAKVAATNLCLAEVTSERDSKFPNYHLKLRRYSGCALDIKGICDTTKHVSYELRGGLGP
jgi:hypothetical protein